MTRETMVMDFLGVGRSEQVCSEDSERGGTLVRPIPSVPETVGTGTLARGSPAPEVARAADRDSSINRLRQGVPSPEKTGRKRPSTGGKDDQDLESGLTEVSSSGLWEAEIMQLSRGDYWRYFEERGMRRPSWNKQMMTGMKQQADSRTDDKLGKPVVAPKLEMTDGPMLGHAPSLSGWEQSAPANPSHPPTTSGMRLQEIAVHQERVRMRAANVMYANRQQGRGVQNTGAQPSSMGEEALQSAQPSERAGPDYLSPARTSMQQHPGFGNSLPPFNKGKGLPGMENGMALAGQRAAQIQQAFLQGEKMATHAATRLAGASKHPRTAQLTIFYAGMVNVYDDVPFDKAQAIMLLAGSGNPWSSNYMNPPVNVGSGRPFSTPMAVPQSTTSRPGSPAPQAATSAAAAPAAVSVILANQRLAKAPPVTHVAELPQARKASLARFLEKRKDRVRKAPYPMRNEGSASPPHERSSSPLNSKPPTRSCSPASTSGARNLLSSSGPGNQACVSSGSEPNSPTTRHPQTPPGQGMSEENSNGTPGGREYERERESSAMGCGRSPGMRSIATESRVEAMDEEMS